MNVMAPGLLTVLLALLWALLPLAILALLVAVIVQLRALNEKVDRLARAAERGGDKP